MIKVNFTESDIEELLEEVRSMSNDQDNEEVFYWLVEDINGTKTNVTITVGPDKD